MPEPSSEPRGGLATTDLADVAAPAALDLETLGADPTGDESGSYQVRRIGVLGYVAGAWLVLVVLGALLAALLPLSPSESFGEIARQGPSVGHWFGGDNIGRDIFTRCLYGARKSLAVGVGSYIGALILGGGIGLVAGYYRGRIESMITAVLDVMLSFPPLVLLIAITSFLGTDVKNLIFALTILAIPNVARIIRANVLAFSQREFVTASRSLGARNMRIMVREILPNVVPAVGGFALVGVANLIVVEGALAFIGSSDPDEASWGVMINQGRDQLDSAPHIVLFPAMMIFLTVLSMNYLGDRVRERLEVKESNV
ncbi:MAG: ABC transporter permease [Acidimicrobiia bacterium]|nr:ABC transporter permease [Acidimicrobiia bacterium]